jgi:hypothetical protein
MTRLGALLASGLLIASCGMPGSQTAAPTAEYSAPSGGSSSRSDGAMSPAQRSGLATGWGTERQSTIYEWDFTRSSNQPVGTDAIYYHDPEGIRAMTRRVDRVGALQEAAGGLVEWGVKGKVMFLPTFMEGATGRRLVQGEKGSAYALVVRNKSFRTLEVVLSVDGLDVMDGATATFSKRGYLVSPGKTLVVEGFRTSNQSVAEFRFSTVAGSYANQKHGDTRNVGVIGLAVFTPKSDRAYATPPGNRGNARPFAESR